MEFVILCQFHTNVFTLNGTLKVSGTQQRSYPCFVDLCKAFDFVLPSYT